MSRRLPVSQPHGARIIHYLDPATTAAPAVPTDPDRLAVQRRRQAALYAQWKKRQQAIAEYDRKVRRFWLGFGAVVALAVLTALAVLGWLIWQALTAINLGALAVPAVLLLAAVLGVGGHRCITVVQHWH